MISEQIVVMRLEGAKERDKSKISLRLLSSLGVWGVDEALNSLEYGP